MTKIHTCIAAISLTLGALVALAGRPPAAPPPTRDQPPVVVRQWFVNNSDKVNVNEPYELHSTLRRELNLTSQLGQIANTFGFLGTKGGHFEFRRPNERDHGPIMHLETVALYNTTFGGYRTATAWVTSPVYEWQIHEQQGARFALYNTKQKDYLVLLPSTRPNGNVGWLGKK